ncbi:MAG: tRNA (adenosine(37)-N6)-threonylcarbamoyltransferase complex ATPase subunit type 1 TsaE [Firmicutes bacterium]|nr:tRNA (adenosine(37)-N6)-threonylcarbamoyltransferase complex ATPase subunit type 1 TsaE [Bacillota bacterium]
MLDYTFKTHEQKETAGFGRFVVPYLSVQSVITLSGDLGAGKTTFASGVAAGLGIHEHVISPTFDAYRLEDGNKDLGLEEFIEGNGITLIEWPQFINKLIPANALHIVIRNLGGDEREIHVSTTNVAYEKMFNNMKEIYQ